jgi:hypothetical protein
MWRLLSPGRDAALCGESSQIDAAGALRAVALRAGAAEMKQA